MVDRRTAQLRLRQDGIVGTLLSEAAFQAQVATAYSRTGSWLASQRHVASSEMLALQRHSDAMWKAFEQTQQLDFKKLHQDLVKGNRAMAKAGWPIVGWLDVRQVRSFAESPPDAITAFFESAYLGESGKLVQLRTNLLQAYALRPWRASVRECFAAFDAKLYRICIPTLLSAFEGLTVQQLARRTKGEQRRRIKRSTAPLKDIRSLRLQGEEDVDGMIWESVYTFHEQLYAHADFTQTAPLHLNRHWILHGRHGVRRKKIDVLRMLNAIDSVLFASS